MTLFGHVGGACLGVIFGLEAPAHAGHDFFSAAANVLVVLIIAAFLQARLWTVSDKDRGVGSALAIYMGQGVAVAMLVAAELGSLNALWHTHNQSPGFEVAVISYVLYVVGWQATAVPLLSSALSRRADQRPRRPMAG